MIDRLRRLRLRQVLVPMCMMVSRVCWRSSATLRCGAIKGVACDKDVGGVVASEGVVGEL